MCSLSDKYIPRPLQKAAATYTTCQVFSVNIQIATKSKGKYISECHESVCTVNKTQRIFHIFKKEIHSKAKPKSPFPTFHCCIYERYHKCNLKDYGEIIGAMLSPSSCEEENNCAGQGHFIAIAIVICKIKGGDIFEVPRLLKNESKYSFCNIKTTKRALCILKAWAEVPLTNTPV